MWKNEDLVGDSLTSLDSSSGVAVAPDDNVNVDDADDSQLSLLFPQVEVDIDDEELDCDEVSFGGRGYFNSIFFFFFSFNIGRIELIIPVGFSKFALLTGFRVNFRQDGGGVRGGRIGVSSEYGYLGVPGWTSQWKGTASAVRE